ncbi:MAG: penicillin-binding protein 2, partial [Spirochaetales bacterium]
LAGYLNMSKTEIERKIPVASRRSYTAIEIKAALSLRDISNIAENIVDLPGVSWRSKPVRNYTFTESMSHIIGYVGNITRDELQVLYNQGYTNNSVIGKTGIEKQYDDLLKGTPGSESRTVDVLGASVSVAPVIKAPVPGNDLILTVDSEIQELAEKALGERVGSAIVLKPSTGEILAMVSYPYFDSNIFNSENFSQEYNAIISNQHNPFLNRAINAEYSPASTFKTLMTAAIIEENTLPVGQEIECPGFLEYGGRIFTCHIGIPGHGHEDLKHALADSCNIYFWTAGRDYLGENKIISYSKEFGFGESLGIDIPGSKSGFVPTPEWKERRYFEQWLGGDTMNLSIGQGYTTVTPLHVANMMAMIVNDGVIYKPHFLKEVRDPITDEILTYIEPEILHESAISDETWETTREYLRYTATDGSSQFPLRNKVVQIAGKSGTSQVAGYTDSWHSWFVSYGPYDAPPEEAVVVCVMVEAVNTWEWWAPYATNIIYQGIFADQTFDEAVDALGFRYLQRPVGRME